LPLLYFQGPAASRPSRAVSVIGCVHRRNGREQTPPDPQTEIDDQNRPRSS